jgi:hypothetical protein
MIQKSVDNFGSTPGQSETTCALHDPLFQTLVSLVLDDPQAAGSFTARLVASHNWSMDHASRVILEYKKFLYLTQRAGHEVTPSPEVDDVWHLHLTYTQSYWGQLCGRVFSRPLHHVPGTDSPEQNEIHQAHYVATLASYERLFGDSAPADIWPRTTARKETVRRWLDIPIAGSAITRRRAIQLLLVGLGLELCCSALWISQLAPLLGAGGLTMFFLAWRISQNLIMRGEVICVAGQVRQAPRLNMRILPEPPSSYAIEPANVCSRKDSEGEQILRESYPPARRLLNDVMG